MPNDGRDPLHFSFGLENFFDRLEIALNDDVFVKFALDLSSTCLSHPNGFLVGKVNEIEYFLGKIGGIANFTKKTILAVLNNFAAPRHIRCNKGFTHCGCFKERAWRALPVGGQGDAVAGGDVRADVVCHSGIFDNSFQAPLVYGGFGYCGAVFRIKKTEKLKPHIRKAGFDDARRNNEFANSFVPQETSDQQERERSRLIRFCLLRTESFEIDTRTGQQRGLFGLHQFEFDKQAAVARQTS